MPTSTFWGRWHALGVHIDFNKEMNVYINETFYRLQRSCGKVKFLHLSVILSTSECIPACTWADTPLGRHLPRADTPPGQTPPPSRRLLQRTVRILLECILVYIDSMLIAPVCVVWQSARSETGRSGVWTWFAPGSTVTSTRPRAAPPVGCSNPPDTPTCKVRTICIERSLVWATTRWFTTSVLIGH